MISQGKSILELEEAPIRLSREIDVPYESLSLTEKYLVNKNEIGDRFTVKKMRIVVDPLAISDPYNMMEFYKRYDDVKAVFVEKTTKTPTFFTLTGVVPFAILGSYKLCDVADFEVDTDV